MERHDERESEVGRMKMSEGKRVCIHASLFLYARTRTSVRFGISSLVGCSKIDEFLLRFVEYVGFHKSVYINDK